MFGFITFVFDEENFKKDPPHLIPTNEGKEYLKFCLLDTQSDYKTQLDKNLQESIEEFFDNYSKLQKSFQDNDVYIERYCNIHATDDCKKNMNGIKEEISKIMGQNDTYFPYKDDLPDITERNGGLFGSFNCSFLKSDLNMVYTSLYDLSVEARVLCALSCCIGFFGAVFVYFYLLVMHHYDNELFFDNRRKSSFIGLEGFGSSKKKNLLDDPATKKRKLNSQIEISSINEEYEANKDDKRNQIE